MLFSPSILSGGWRKREGKLEEKRERGSFLRANQYDKGVRTSPMSKRKAFCGGHTQTDIISQRPGPCHDNLANYKYLVNEEWQRPSDENHI